MTGFTDVFSSSVIYPAQTTLLKLAFAANVTLQWPIEQQTPGLPVVADILELTPAADGLSVIMPDARQATEGFTSLFNNVSAHTVTIKDASGNTLMTVASGQAWQMYLDDNTTLNGTWKIFQYGAGASSANAAALAGAGLKAISTTLNQSMPINAQTADYAIVNGDRAKAVVWKGGAGNFTLPDPATLGSDWFVAIVNGGTGSVTVTPTVGRIDGQASKIFSLGTSAFIITDGTNYFSLGFGQSINSVFDFLSLDVSGTGDFVLTGAQLNRISYRFTGVLTGDRNIIVPALVQQYWVDNQTSGAFLLHVKTATQVTGIQIPQGRRSILYCDGVNVVEAETIAVSTPVQVPQGGTGLTSGVQGALLYFNSTVTMADTGVLAQNQVLLGGGTAGPPTVAAPGTATQVLHGNAAGAPTFSAVDLAADVTGNLGVGHLNGGAGANAGSVWRGDATWGDAATADNALALGGVAASNFAQKNAVNNFTAVNSFGVKVYSPFITLVDAATIAINTDLGNNFEVTLGGNRTMGAPSNTSDGHSIKLVVRQDGTGGRTLVFPAAYQFSDGVAPVLLTTPGAEDIFEGVFNATSGVFLMEHWPNVSGGTTNISLSGNAVGVNAFALAGSPGGVVTVNFNVGIGIVLYAPDTLTAALDFSGFTAGSTINLINQGYILGRGGEGGMGAAALDPGSGISIQSGEDGAVGGLAIKGPGAGNTFNITNATGFIYGGGGGGGGGGASVDSTGSADGGGGGGGAGSGKGGKGGRYGNGSTQLAASNGIGGSNGPNGALGAGGAGNGSGVGSGSAGGAGGTWGAAGTAGTANAVHSEAATAGGAGAAGPAIDNSGTGVTFVSGGAAPHVKGAII